MKNAELTVTWRLDIECPYCTTDFDISNASADDNACFTGPISSNRWHDLVGMEVTCPECGKYFTIASVDPG